MDPEKWSRLDENASKEEVMEFPAAVVSNCDEGLNGMKTDCWTDLYRMGVYIEGGKQSRHSVLQSDRFTIGEAT